MAKLAEIYLTPPPTSTDVERLFSTAGDTITNERNRLLPATAEMLLFLRENLPRINFKYYILWIFWSRSGPVPRNGPEVPVRSRSGTDRKCRSGRTLDKNIPRAIGYHSRILEPHEKQYSAYLNEQLAYMKPCRNGTASHCDKSTNFVQKPIPPFKFF